MVLEMKWWCFRPLLCTLFRLNWAKKKKKKGFGVSWILHVRLQLILLADCSISWSKQTGTKSTGASDQGAMDVSACMSICVDEPSCLAVDYDKVAGICWTHTQADKLKTTVQDSSADQYILERCSSQYPYL